MEDRHQGLFWLRIYTMVIFVAYLAAALLRTAVVVATQGKGGLIITCQALRNMAITVWSLFFLVFMWVKKRKIGGVHAHLQFVQTRKWRYRTMGIYLLVIGFIHFGDPSLVLMYGGPEAISQFTGISPFVSQIDPLLAFDVTIGIVVYGIFVGFLLVAVSVKIREKNSTPPSAT
ncbi:hypothetical protein H4R19_002615 [Coemansia spiralis]|nr:hypothetical protein H4R19_002615 [Coemansia spiralis]